MSFTDYLEARLLDHLLGDPSYSPPGTLYVGLFTTEPTDDGSGGVEASGGSYARIATTAADWGAASGGSKANSSALTFPTPSSSWGTVVAFGLWDALTSGNLLAVGQLATSRLVNVGRPPQFRVGDLLISLD